MPIKNPSDNAELPLHKRRVRYKGRNPRHFNEKYKEHDPERYSDEVLKIIQSGKTPAGTHRPIMVQEILAALEPRAGQTVLDATLQEQYDNSRSRSARLHWVHRSLE